MQKIIAPTNCPSCNSMLVQVNDQLFCKNNDCESKQQKIVEHFAKTLKIKGLGPMSIQKLQINSINEIYELTNDELVTVLGSAVGNKLSAEIAKSKEVSLNQLLPAFGIPLVGTSAAKKLCAVIDSIYDISYNTCMQAGLGPKVTENLLTWYETEFESTLSSLDFSFKSYKEQEKPIKGIVCITGKLFSYKTKDIAKSLLEQAGYAVRSTVTREVTILVNESGIESAKTQKARESGVTIVTNVNDLIEVM
jgi:DNA ligase (NAD+)